MPTHRPGRWITVTAWATLALGTVHVALTGVVFRELRIDLLPRDGRLGFLFVFVATGLATLFAGGLSLFAAAGVRRREAWAAKLAAAAGAFVGVIGLAAVATGPDNPFAWVSLAVGAGQVVAARRARAG